MKICLLGKSGVGKTTQERIMSNLTGMPRLISLTTRNPRDYEVEGVDYRFVSNETFKSFIDDGSLAEYTYFKGNYYGIESSRVDSHCIIVAEPNGLDQFKKVFNDMICIKIVLNEDDRILRLEERGGKFTQVDESRFDEFEADFEVDGSGTEEEVTDRLISAYREAQKTQDHLIPLKVSEDPTISFNMLFKFIKSECEHIFESLDDYYTFIELSQSSMYLKALRYTLYNINKSLKTAEEHVRDLVTIEQYELLASCLTNGDNLYNCQDMWLFCKYYLPKIYVKVCIGANIKDPSEFVDSFSAYFSGEKDVTI